MKRGERIVIAGGSGYLGQALAARLVKRGVEPVILTRQARAYRGPGRAVLWNGRNGDWQWVKELDGAAAVVNLAGKNVNCRPTRANREEVLRSRVDSVMAVGEGMRRCETPPPVWVQASSLAIFGDSGDRVCDDFGHVANGYPADICVEWEAALGKAVMPATRWVAMRIGFVMGRGGGALPLLEKLAHFGLGGSIGRGRQWMSWIHEEDMMAVFLRALDEESMSGTYNVTAPEPVRNAELMRELRRAMGRGWQPPAPGPAVWLGAWAMGSDPKIALTGRRGVPGRLLEEGFEFRFARLEEALGELFMKKKMRLTNVLERIGWR